MPESFNTKNQNNSILPKVGILIPTMNRSEFLYRQLRYYVSVKSPHPVYIGDASNNKHSKKIKNYINKLNSKVKINYNHWPELNDRQTIHKLGQICNEKYCAFTGDDDFLVPNSLTKCATFLQNNLDYRTAQGKGVLFSLDKSGAFGSVNSFGSYWIRQEAEEESASSRILNFAQNYWVPQFSVHRCDEFREDSINYAKVIDKSFGELLHSFTFICKGKSKFINTLYLFRQCHEQQYNLPNILDWIAGPEWHLSYDYFIETVSTEIKKLDPDINKDPQDITKKAFWFYLYHCIEKSNSVKLVNDVSLRSQLIKYINKLPRLKKIIKTVIKNKDQLSLRSLKHKSSPYHEDFIPVYKMLTDNKN